MGRSACPRTIPSTAQRISGGLRRGAKSPRPDAVSEGTAAVITVVYAARRHGDNAPDPVVVDEELAADPKAEEALCLALSQTQRCFRLVRNGGKQRGLGNGVQFVMAGGVSEGAIQCIQRDGRATLGFQYREAGSLATNAALGKWDTPRIVASPGRAYSLPLEHASRRSIVRPTPDHGLLAEDPSRWRRAKTDRARILAGHRRLLVHGSHREGSELFRKWEYLRPTPPPAAGRIGRGDPGRNPQ